MDTELEIPQKEMKSNIKNLTIVLASEMFLFVKIRKSHWNVAGENFMEMHKILEDQYNELELIIDEVAERIGKLGGKAIGTVGEFNNHSILNDQSFLKECTKHEEKDAMAKEILDDYRTLISKIRDFNKETEERDDFGTADFLTTIIQKHEEQAWILKRHNNKININLNLKQNFTDLTEDHLFNKKAKAIESFSKIQQKIRGTEDEVKKKMQNYNQLLKKKSAVYILLVTLNSY
jgi:starvation-inducible DNA-binding protein